jgi:Holliday junction resolvasome RuvABC endonuclease subunit
MTAVLGLDLSLTGCGVAGDGWADTITFPPRKRREDRTDYSHRRLAHIKTSLRDFLTGVQFVAMEGLSYDSYDTNRQSAGLAWIVRHDLLWARGIPYALVPPANLKQYVTGSGAADKTQMVAAIQGWFPWFDGDDNAADAAGLHAMACDWLGQPAVEVPPKQRKALDGCEWPELSLFNAA